MIRAGDLDRRIAIQRATTTRDPDTNEEIPSWSTVATVAAGVRQTAGREFLDGSAMVGEQRAVFVIRFLGGVTVLDRVLFGSTVFDLDDVREIGRREGLELHGRAVA